MDETTREDLGRGLLPALVGADEVVRRVRAVGAGSVIDVRSPVEVLGESVPGAVAVPLDQLEARLDEVRAVPAPRLLLCRSGARAGKAMETLTALGVDGLSVMSGGLEAYRAAGGSTVSAGSHMSLERQVRVAAGSLSLLGVILGFLLHPGFFGLSGFVGAGLVFAGVTDWCGMGLLLARAPWNQRPGTRAQPSDTLSQ